MNPLRKQLITALQLSGKGDRTQEAYVREVRLLSQFYDKSPGRISEPELQNYFLHRKNVDHLAPNSMRICYSAIRFFYQHVLSGNRHCPECQHHKTQQWLQLHLEKQLPGPHFLITCTVPETLRPFIRSHQRIAYQALFVRQVMTLRAMPDARTQD